MRVDFDPEAGSSNGRGRLVFSLLSGDEEAAGSSAEARSEMVNRLAGQAAPLMTRLLRRYGEAHATLRTTAEDPVQALAGLPIDELRRMLRALVTASRTAVGVKVSLRGLRGRVELNGAEGFVLEYLGEGGRFRVALSPEGEGEEGGSAEMVAVMRANLSDPVVEELPSGFTERHTLPPDYNVTDLLFRLAMEETLRGGPADPSLSNNERCHGIQDRERVRLVNAMALVAGPC